MSVADFDWFLLKVVVLRDIQQGIRGRPKMMSKSNIDITSGLSVASKYG